MTITTAGRHDAVLDLSAALMRAYGIRPARPHRSNGLMTALRRVVADWREQRWQRAVARTTAHLGDHMRRDIGMTIVPARQEWLQ